MTRLGVSQYYTPLQVIGVLAWGVPALSTALWWCRQQPPETKQNTPKKVGREFIERADPGL